MSRPESPRVVPLPPRAGPNLPWVGVGLSLLRNPTGFFQSRREQLGDTYGADAFGRRLFCVFSPEGVRRLYELPESEASFGLATFNLLTTKVPAELFIGRRNRPHDLFGNEGVEHYLDVLKEAVQLEIGELGSQGRFEIFSRMRRLGHRLGLGAWAGPEAASARYLDRLIPLLDRLDSSDAFVRPVQALIAQASRKVRERRALQGIETVIEEILTGRQRNRARPGDFLDQIWESFADLGPEARVVAVARDVTVLHMGAQSNLYAALAWTLINVITRPEILARVREGDDMLLEQCANESIRMAQRSLTLRQVFKPVELNDGRTTYRIGEGVLIATMLPVNNCSAAPGLERFNPANYDGRRLSGEICLPARELVSTFGHGRHACPAQRFAITAIRIAVRELLQRYRFTPRFRDAAPRQRQLGGVGRAERPCVVEYQQRDDRR